MTSEPPAPGADERAEPKPLLRYQAGATRWLKRLASPPGVLLSLVVLAAALVTLYVHDYPTISPADELQHIDYMLKASDGHLVARGDQFGQQALREETCRRVDSPFTVKVPRCGSTHLKPATFQEGGYNTAFVHPPVYYAVDGGLARGVLAVTPGHHDVVTMARLIGILWLTAAVVLIWLVLGEFATPVAVRAVLIVLLLTAPTVLHFSSIVNPDASALATGAAILLAVLRFERKKGSWIPPAVISAVAIGLKVTNAFGVGVCLIYLGVRWLQARVANDREGGEAGSGARRLDTRQLVIVAGAMIASMAFIAVVWSSVSAAIAHVPAGRIPLTHRYQVTSFPTKALKSEWRAAISPLKAPYIPSFLRSARIVRIATIVDAALIAATILGIAFSERGSRIRALAISALLVMALVGPVVLTFNYFGQGVWYRPGTVPRYGLSILPAALVASTVALRHRGILLASWALAGLVLVSTIVQMARA